MKKLFYLFTFILAVTFTACDNGQPDGPSGDSNVPENPSNPNEPSNPNQPSEPSKPEEPANGHEFVDLGLSVKWATCNVGANTPEEYGDYFAWGETKPKDNYSWSTYKWCNGSMDNLTKYCIEPDSDYGIVDNKTVLDIEDDAAHVNWGGAWRMPTIEDVQELINNCSWTWATQNGVNGCILTSKINGNSIFFPAAGYRENSHFFDLFGFYWSSSLYNKLSTKAYHLHFSLSGVEWYVTIRNHANPIRPVLP